jgi:hypothetical protein
MNGMGKGEEEGEGEGEGERESYVDVICSDLEKCVVATKGVLAAI